MKNTSRFTAKTWIITTATNWLTWKQWTICSKACCNCKSPASTLDMHFCCTRNKASQTKMICLHSRIINILLGTFERHLGLVLDKERSFTNILAQSNQHLSGHRARCSRWRGESWNHLILCLESGSIAALRRPIQQVLEETGACNQPRLAPGQLNEWGQ